MTSDPQEKEETSIEEDLKETLVQCIRVLLQSLDNRIANLEDDQEKDIGTIQIIVDERGMIAGQVQEQSSGAPTCGLFIMCVETKEVAYALERFLAQCAYNTKLIVGIIKEINPAYADPRWQAELDTACEEVEEVLIKATFILPGSPMHDFLRKATQASRC